MSNVVNLNAPHDEQLMQAYIYAMHNTSDGAAAVEYFLAAEAIRKTMRQYRRDADVIYNEAVRRAKAVR